MPFSNVNRTNPSSGSKFVTYLTSSSEHIQGVMVLDTTGAERVVALDVTVQAVRDRLPSSIGQKAANASLSVVLASDHAAVPISASSLPLPTGAATQTTLATLLTGTVFTTSIGEVQASPTANTLLGRLKDLLTQISLAAGSALIGKVQIRNSSGSADINPLTDTELRLTPVSVTATTDTPTALATNRKANTTPGTAVQLITASTPCKRVIVSTPTSNSDVISIGGSGAKAGVGVEQGSLLQPGSSDSIYISDVNKVYFDVIGSGDAVSFRYES